MKTIALALLILLYSITYAQEPTKWRGPAGSGVYPDVGLLKQWPPKGPEMLWHFSGLGEGHSSPVFANDMIYINGMINRTGFLFVLSESGTLIDKFQYGEEYFSSYPGTRSSVTVAGDLAYVMTGQGRLVCMNTRDGKIEWVKHMFRNFGGRNTQWGITETVVVDGNTVYCTPGGGKYNVVALNRFTGNIIWTSEGKRNLSAYCTPLLIKLPSRKVLVTHTANNIICLDASDGTLLWSQGHTNTYSVHPNTPIYYDGSVYCFSGYGQGGSMIEMDDMGNKKGIRWRDKTLDSRMGGAVLVDGFIYGSGDNNRTWKSLNWETGEQGFSSSLVGPGNVISADGNLYCYSQRGELAMVPANPSVFRITGKIRVEMGTGQHWAHPVINKGRLFVRHGNSLIAYKIK